MTDSRRRLRVLLSAYACEPGKGSEAGNGWNWARELSRYEDVWVLTRANNREVIENELAAHPLPNAHFVYLDLPRWGRFWKKGSRGAAPLLLSVASDCLPHGSAITSPGAIRHHSPRFVCNLCVSRLSVVFAGALRVGTGRGGETIPSSLTQSFGVRRRIDEFLRNFRRSLGELDPFVRRTAKKAALIAATTSDTQKRLATLGRADVSVTPHAALCEEDISVLREIPVRTESPFRVLTVGRMVPFKAHDLGLRAFAALLRQHHESEYWVVGDGPERRGLTKLACALGIEDRVTFLGALPRDEVFAKLRECDAMLFPSLHDSSGWASIEAMAAARPVVCLDLGGPALQVAEDRGIKVPAVNMEQIIADLGAALIRLASDPALQMRLGYAGRLYVEQNHTWTRIVRDFDDHYHRLLSVASPTRAIEPTAHATTKERNAAIPPAPIHP